MLNNLQSAWQNFKSKLGTVAAVVIGILTLAFLLEKSQKEGVEEKLLNKDSEDKDKELKDQQTALEQQNKQIQQQAEQEKKQPITEQEALDTLNNV